jgi:hypothetical protein
MYRVLLSPRTFTGAAARIKTREEQLRRTTHDLPTRLAKYIEFDGGVFGNLF